ncbi:endoplasmic reticulum protein SC65 [Polypterus senegalus]|uniref:endoplasmic reticulum protein SC65 n=1 Tax=Polypterus senegalus TaxID=55291 RepID=UPI0019643E98|nr:endoplasmic reticulum protein SC65 [Polypterus senegalus]
MALRGAEPRLIACVFVGLLVVLRAQYEKYSFRSFPANELMPLESAYGYALDQYQAQNWKEAIRYLESSLRLHRLLKDCQAFCHQNCSSAGRQEEIQFTDSELRVFSHVLQRASCLKKCKSSFPVFSVTQPRKEILDAFEARVPYRYLQYANFQDSNLEKAVSAAHTFLQKNPEDPMMLKNMNYFKTLFDVEEYLIDLEERPYESLFIKSVKLYNTGDFSSSVRDMEQCLVEYFKSYELCLAGCEGAYEVKEFKDFYPAVADHYADTLKCKIKCENSLVPNVGGFFVEKFVATMFHYLQFSYYKLNDIKNAAPCAASYLLFDPSDEIMLQNMVYYRFYREKWGLDDDHFKPRTEALKYFNVTTMQRQMLEFIKNYMQSDDEGVVSPEMSSVPPVESPDAEFDGLGDYEESLYSVWWQEPKSKGDTGEPA